MPAAIESIIMHSHEKSTRETNAPMSLKTLHKNHVATKPGFVSAAEDPRKLGRRCECSASSVCDAFVQGARQRKITQVLGKGIKANHKPCEKQKKKARATRAPDHAGGIQGFRLQFDVRFETYSGLGRFVNRCAAGLKIHALRFAHNVPYTA